MNKDGLDLYVVNDKGERTDVIDDKAIEDVMALLKQQSTDTSGDRKAHV